MLNELLEYQEYTKPITKDLAPRRLIPELFTPANPEKYGNFLGLERALTIIARYHLFHNYDYSAASLDEQPAIIESVKDILKTWCGFQDAACSGQDISFAGWLRDYYISYIETPRNSDSLMSDGTKKKKAIKNPVPLWEDIAEKKKNQFNKRLFTTNGVTEKDNSYKAITYERIIADAIYYGPLHNYYLVCKASYYENLENDHSIITGNNIMSQRYRNLILKYIAAYLIKKQYSVENEFVIVNRTDIANWAQQKINNGDYFKKFTYRDTTSSQVLHKELFTSTIVGGNIAKTRINPNYLEKYDFKIVDEKDFKALPDGYICFTDCGSGTALKSSNPQV